MKSMNKQGRELCEIQAKLFEQSISKLEMSSEVFVRRYMNSKIVKELDSLAFLEDTKTIEDIFDSLDEQYGPSTYGSVKYHRDIMYWCGYLYRYFSYCYEISSKQAYKILPLKYVAGTYLSYHTLDISQAINRLLETKNLNYDEAQMNKNGVSILKRIKAQEVIRLVKLSEEYKNQLFEMMDEWTSSGDTSHTPYAIFKNDYHNFDYYLSHLDVKEPTNGLVPDSTFFAIDISRNIFVGAINIRHYLNEKLLLDGGHIGDGVRPSERRKGYATEIIRLGLIECQKLGIKKVLMVCDKDNIGSRKSIINNGGVLENEIEVDGVIEQRFWITLK